MTKDQVVEIMKLGFGDDFGTCDPDVWYAFLWNFDYEVGRFNAECYSAIVTDRPLTIADVLHGPMGCVGPNEVH